MFRKCCSLRMSGDDIKTLKLYLRISQEQENSMNISCCSVPDLISSCFVCKVSVTKMNVTIIQSVTSFGRRLPCHSLLKKNVIKKRRTRYWISYSIWSRFYEVWSDKLLEKITNLWFSSFVFPTIQFRWLTQNTCRTFGR